MLYYLNSEDLVKYFLPFEKDKDILNSWYVLVSTRISGRSGDNIENIINAKNILYPGAEACSASTDAKFVDKYIKQVKKNKTFLASLIKGSIEENSQIFFLCSKNEDKLKFFPIIADVIWEEFNYPMYSYIDFTAGCDLKEFDEKKVLVKCNKLIDQAHRKGLVTNGNEKEQRKYFKSKSKKELKKMLQKENLYTKGMDKEDMIEMVEEFKELFL